ncbi:thiamine diphosphokinase [Mesoplasma entomophilum]|uniref:Thiamine diphosphokinase n=1 Tax=Mesoplasma entomophilum TaxID=2149 RepID=A0A3S5XZV4_9MOLU|nr:thiamine diphosphokinase [Mesoplasma entomophilum]ATQ35380.1 thiamine diphosphokinase [Mesoplasma entomophilum]ATZ19336.1 thiamine pyrophosphokinase [Mesoplasma entomophilum]AVN60240.1 thiamine diphosphokinase [Mesoplasma entomophilum]
MIKNIVIVTSKTKIDLSVFNNDQTYIIGIERGCLDLIEKNIKIDLAISDFDQVLDEELEMIKSYSKRIQILSGEKDLLDGEVAIKEAKKISSTANILFIANPTKRYDMNFSILNLIFKYGIKLLNDESVIFKIPSGKTELEFSNFQIYTFISFFSKVDTTITLKNLKYECDKLELKAWENTCISNAMVLSKNPIINTNNEIICIATK